MSHGNRLPMTLVLTAITASAAHLAIDAGADGLVHPFTDRGFTGRPDAGPLAFRLNQVRVQ